MIHRYTKPEFVDLTKADAHAAVVHLDRALMALCRAGDRYEVDSEHVRFLINSINAETAL